MEECGSGGVITYPLATHPLMYNRNRHLSALKLRRLRIGVGMVMDEYAADGAYPAVFDCGVLPGRMKEYTVRG